jgi:hypothetical protein
MKRALLLASVLVALWTAACGGGSAPPPPPPVGQFSVSSLNGQYAFFMPGSAINTGFFARAGTFTANGSGTITGGVEDVNIQGVTSRLTFSSGSTYTINADGRGLLNLTNSTGTLQFSITLTSNNGGLIIAIPTDGSSTASGTFAKQNTAAFSLSGIANNYAFDFSGLDPNGVPESFLGHLLADGAGTFTSGIGDDNDGGVPTAPLAPASLAGSTYAVDSLNSGDLAAFGRGVINIAGIKGVFYIVDLTRFYFLEAGSGGILVGSAVQQSGVPTSVNGISGGFVFVIGGATSGGPFVRGGRFSTSGGALSSILIDQNDAGSTKSFPNPSGATSGTYTIDAAGTGRGVATFTLPGAGSGPFTFVFYLTSPTSGFIQDQSPDIISDGTLLGQPTTTISNSSLASNYAFGWSGLTSSSGIADEEDIVGQLKLNNGSFTGTADLNEFSALKQFLAFGVNGTLALNGDGTGHNTFTISLQTSPATNNIPFFAYVGQNNTILLLSTQSQRVVAGVLNPQP